MASPAQNRRRNWSAVVGAVVLVIANAVWARLAGGSEWKDPAVVLAPIAAMIGAAAGWGAAAIAERRTR